MQIDYSQVLKSLNGKPYQAEGMDVTLGDIVSEALATDQNGGKMKLFSLAEIAYKKKPAEIDAPDLAVVKGAVEGCKSYNSHILGQCLTLLEQVK